MSLTLTATDAATAPTGVACGLAGTGGGAAVVYGFRVDSPADGWATLGGRTGDGTVTLAAAKGVWWLYAEAGADRTVPQVVQVTDGRAAAATRCRKAVRDRILLLDLPELGGRVYEHALPDETAVEAYPCVQLTVEAASERKGVGTNAADDVAHPVKVLICDRNNVQFDHSMLPILELWRHRIDRAFDERPLPGVPESLYCKVEPLVILDPDLPAYQHVVSGLVIRCWCRQPRGLNV